MSNMSTIQFPSRNPGTRQRKIIMFDAKMPERTFQVPVVSWYPQLHLPFRYNEPKSSQPRHAASLFLGGTTWPLRQGALSRSFFGGGGGNSVLKGGLWLCGGGNVHLKFPRDEN